MTTAHLDPESCLQRADLRVLLMCIVHLTGDLSWLEAPYSPVRDVRLIPDPAAGLDHDTQVRIREAAAALIRRGLDAPPVIRDPGDALMQRMMRVTLGEDVPPEYAPMMREELGFVARVGPPDNEPAGQPGTQSVLIVGAGLSSIALAVRLKEMGIPFRIIEKDEDVGGVWFRNRYPGCGVDTPNHAYSYSFGQRYSWTRYFSRREEILDYARGVVNEFGLREYMTFQAEVTGAQWQADEKNWRVTFRQHGGEFTTHSRFLVSAIGQLSDPQLPRIQGMDGFKGVCFHSMHWPDNLDITGKRVAIVGTGATAMQLVPSICAAAARVDVYQRSPQWVRPIEGYANSISPESRWLLEHMPFYAEWFRLNMSWRYGDGLLACLRKDPDWPHPERSVNRTNDRHRVEMTEIIEQKLAGRPDLIQKCVPDYPPYGKRILLDNGWYETVSRDNVELITDKIDRITEKGIGCVDGTVREVDVIVYATGFKLTQMAARLNIEGEEGMPLAETWKDDDPKAYLGITVPGFPNFFNLVGPNSAPAHGGSVLFQAECQARYILSCIKTLRKVGASALALKPAVLDEHLRRVDAEHDMLVWTHPAVSTYYRNRKGRVFSVVPWRFVDYWSMTRELCLDDYVLS